MRTVTLTCVLAAMLAPAVAQAADVYAPAPAYRTPPAAYVHPPRYAYPPAPMVVERPVGAMRVPEGWAYVVPAPVYQPGHEYVQSPVLLDGRYYRDCWYEWGQLRCAVRRHW